MGDSWTGRRRVTLTIRILTVLIAMMAVGVTGLAIIGSHLRGPLVRFYAAQAGEAIALGVLLTTVAAMLAFVDPGLAEDMDCAALLADAQQGAK